MSLKQNLLKHISNSIGWRTNRKLIIIESDDWGSIRMPSLRVYEELKKKGLNLDSGDSHRYNTNDTLERRGDLDLLFNTLVKFKDRTGKHPVITAVSLTSNPDFNKIKESNFQCYFHEPFTSTLDRYYSDNAFDLWKIGISEKIFVPQFHGREHLNVAVWMRDLQANNKHTLEAFDHGFWGFKNANKNNIRYQAAFDLSDLVEIEDQKMIIEEGLSIFNELHGYKASFFVPPNGPINNHLEVTAGINGIKYISTAKIQKESLGNSKTKTRFHYLGQKNKNSQYYITRNCFFEPSVLGKDWVNSCINEIDIAFQWKKPAIISSHRVNYIGGLNIKNRDNGLLNLELLLNKIINKWPDIEFISSDQLGELINRS